MRRKKNLREPELFVRFHWTEEKQIEREFHFIDLRMLVNCSRARHKRMKNTCQASRIETKSKKNFFSCFKTRRVNNPIRVYWLNSCWLFHRRLFFRVIWWSETPTWESWASRVNIASVWIQLCQQANMVTWHRATMTNLCLSARRHLFVPFSAAAMYGRIQLSNLLATTVFEIYDVQALIERW